MRAASRLLNASTQAAVAAMTVSLSAESAVESAAAEVTVVFERAVGFGSSYSIGRPLRRLRVSLTRDLAAAASTASISTQVGFGVKAKNSGALDFTSRSMRLSS